jgi:DNA-binding transcriptional MerR regulator
MTMTAESQIMGLAELAEKSGVPGRTIRFYIARGLLSGPFKAGRGASYGPEHLQRLREIGALQARGLTLEEIARRSAESSGTVSPAPTACWQYQVADDVVVTVRAEVSPWRMKQIRKHLAILAAGLCQLETIGKEKQHDSE